MAVFLAFSKGGMAQTMPQDTWRYDQVEMASPEPDKYLRCIGIGPGGVYVGEGTNSSTSATRVLQFTTSGAFVRRFNAVFGFILGISCDSAGNVYVLDRGDSKVKAFAGDGTFIRDWGGTGSGDGQFSLGSVSGYNMIAVDKTDSIYVCDSGNRRVQVFNGSGAFLRKWGEPGSLPGQFSTNDPRGITISADNRVVVYCSNNSPSLRIFNPQGQFINSHSSYSPEPMAFTPDGLLLFQNYSFYAFDARLSDVTASYDLGGYYPSNNSWGIATDSRGDLFAVSGNARRVRVFEREYSSVNNPLLPSAMPQPMVLNVAQRAGVPLLDIDYRVVDTDSSAVSTAALAFLGGNNTLSDVVRMSTFVEGTASNLGANQSTGVEKRITWDMAADWSVDFAQIQVEVLAKDNRNPLGIHWITVPAEGNQPAFEISRAPVSDAQLLSIWYWFIATQESGMTLANGSVNATGGIYGTRQLATGTTTTTTGRTFAYQKLGFRGVGPSEMQRAQAGNYGLSSVTQNSVVREAVTANTFLRGWGDNGYSKSTVSPGLSLTSILAVAAGAGHSLVLSTDGNLSTWGYNGHGVLGDGTTTDRTYPVQVTSGVSAIATGYYHSLYVKSDGTLWGIGNNSGGQLGDNSTTNRSVPIQIATGVSTSTSAIAAGNNHSLFVKADGTLWGMGYNNSGQLGDGSTTHRLTPVQVATGVSAVAAGNDFSLFIKTDGSLWAMGYNGQGQLGDNTTTNRSTPFQVTTGVSSIACGGNHSMFVKTDGTLRGMGNNGSGQLGDGTTTQRRVSVQIATGVSAVTVGSDHSVFIKTDGTLWAMGYNSSGQLGDGTTTQRLSPVQVGTSALKVGCGCYSNHTLAVFGAP